MNKEEIVRLAKEADVWVAGQEPYRAQLERFAGLRDHPNMQRLVAELLHGIVDCMESRGRNALP